MLRRVLPLETRTSSHQRLSSSVFLQCVLVCQRGAGGAACCFCWYTFESWVQSSLEVGTILVHHPVKVCAITAPSQPPLPLTPHSLMPCSCAHSHSLTASCAIHAAGGLRPLPLPPYLVS